MLGFLRQFLVWLHRAEAFEWRDRDRIIEDAARRRRTRMLMTPHERKSEAAGPATWTRDQLVTLYRYATDRERLFMLLGLNGGFAQSEIIHLLPEEVELDHDPPRVRYIRHKSSKPGGFALWPVTAEALRWHATLQTGQAGPEVPWLIRTSTGQPLTRQMISNAWSGLLRRVSRRHPDFPRHSFKVLRKTAAELVQGPGGGDSQVIAIMEARAKRTVLDDQADRYYSRRFDDVYRANTAVGVYLEPLFAAAPEAFRGTRTRPMRKIGPEAAERMRLLIDAGVGVADVALKFGCAPATVRHHLRQRQKTRPVRAEAPT